MRRALGLLGVAVLGTAFIVQHADAALFSFPRTLKHHMERLQMQEPALAPMAHTRFCLQYAGECRPQRMVFRGGSVKLTDERWAELRSVNTMVNRAIRPQANTRGVVNEEWVISPVAGDCNDYAVTKRHELIKRGWSPRALLLAEVVIGSGEHHLVLVVRTSAGDVVLDNLNANVRLVGATRYRWVRMQSPKNPQFWSTVGRTMA
jgi:predicted transglutaminase-like cysteine proteinase